MIDLPGFIRLSPIGKKLTFLSIDLDLQGHKVISQLVVLFVSTSPSPSLVRIGTLVLPQLILEVPLNVHVKKGPTSEQNVS